MKTVLISVILPALVSVGMSRWFSRQPPVNLHDAAWLQRELRRSVRQAAGELERWLEVHAAKTGAGRRLQIELATHDLNHRSRD